MMRRGVLRGAAALLGAAAAGVSRVAGAREVGRLPEHAAMATSSYARGMQVAGPPDDVTQRAWQALEVLQGKRWRATRMQDEVLALHGGWPPHILANQSNALWFRAMCAVRWREERRRREEGWEDRIRRELGLPPAVHGP